MELGIYVAYEERKVGIAFGVSGIKVKVTVTKNRKMVSNRAFPVDNFS